MTAVMARLVAVFTALLLVAVLVALYITSHPGATSTQVKAEFADVYPLLPGMHVRVDGAIAGSVGNIDITDRGTALVTMELFEGTSPPRADATAAIRQQDITGDSYVALEPGDDPHPLGESVIGTRNTIVAPRFDDLLNSFDEPVRQGLTLVLTELGKGLERRGDDLNGAVLALRPGLQAADQALAEVRSQNGALRSLITDAEAVTGQAAEHSRALGGLVESLSTTLRTTAERGPALDAALERLPATADIARRTLGKLATVATKSQPLARTLAGAAPDLATTFRRLGPFLDDARATMDSVGPTLSLVDYLLTASLPTLRAAPARVLTAPLDIAGAAGAVLKSLLGERDLQRALFSADGYGQGPKAQDDVGLGAIGVEQGTQAGYEGNDPDRHFIRAETVLTCETFGRPIRPGCLNDAINATRAGAGERSGGGDNSAHGGSNDGNDGNGGEGGGAPQPGPGAAGDLGDQLGQTLNGAGGDVGEILDQVGGVVGDGLGGDKPGRDHGGSSNLGAAEDLLDFLAGP